MCDEKIKRTKNFIPQYFNLTYEPDFCGFEILFPSRD